MPDFTITEEAVKDRVAAQLHRAAIAAAVERRGSAGPRGLWRCSCCGEALSPDEPATSAWRFCDGEPQHKCPQCPVQEGPNPCRWFGDMPPPIMPTTTNLGLDWIPCGDDGTATAGDGVYLVRPVRTGFIATELIDGIETISPIMPEGLCREWCEARWRDREMPKTKEHAVLPDVAYEVTGPDMTTDDYLDREPIQPGDYGYYREPGAADR